MKRIVTAVRSRDHTTHASVCAGLDVACCRCLVYHLRISTRDRSVCTLGGGLTLRLLECVGRSAPALTPVSKYLSSYDDDPFVDFYPPSAVVSCHLCFVQYRTVTMVPAKRSASD
jgi:hypothetical protein